jgi:hypothetical protein
MPVGSGDTAGPSEDAVVGQVRSVFEQLPAEHFPLLRALAPTMTTGSADERFGFGIDLLISGLKALSTQRRGG